MFDIYGELRRASFRMFKPEYTAGVRPRATEAFLGLIKPDSALWESQRHFLTTAAHRVRQVLVDHARTGQQIELVENSVFSRNDLRNVLAIDDALTRMERFSPESARIVELRIFAGLSNSETADVIGVDASAARAQWEFAHAWLSREIERAR